MQGNETKDKKIEISSKKEFQLSFGCPWSSLPLLIPKNTEQGGQWAFSCI